METSLHRQLKERYRKKRSQLEALVGRYRIDVVTGKQLIEIQHGSLAAIRDKARELSRDHPLVIVKPIITRRHLVRLGHKQGPVIGRRMSPKRGSILDLFDELVYFTRVFPHPNVRLDVPLVEIEEWRYPGHGRRRRWRRRDHVLEDQRLISIQRTYSFRQADELMNLIEAPLPAQFHTGHLAGALARDRGFAQRVAYCLRETGAVIQVGKQGNTLLYQRNDGNVPAVA
jgi:hypothetical protein